MISRVAVLALPGVTLFELGIASELFGVDRTDTGGGRFDLTICTVVPGMVISDLGLPLRIDAGLDAAADADLVIVLPYADLDSPPVEVLDALRAAHDRGAWLLSICSGAFALAEAGLLDGRRCTTHWRSADALARKFPLADVDPSVLYVEDDRIVTSAGSAAGIDAGLHLIRTDRGAQVAANIARRMVVPPHRDGGQAQYIERPVLVCDSDSLTEVLQWMVAHLDVDQSVDELATRALMSPRTFARRFRAETGTTPAAWLAQQRLQRARELLETSSYSIDRIAELAGFGTAPVLRHHFTRALRTSPQAYRRRFACVDSGDEQTEVAGRTLLDAVG